MGRGEEDCKLHFAPGNIIVRIIPLYFVIWIYHIIINLPFNYFRKIISYISHHYHLMIFSYFLSEFRTTYFHFHFRIYVFQDLPSLYAIYITWSFGTFMHKSLLFFIMVCWIKYMLLYNLFCPHHFCKVCNIILI